MAITRKAGQFRGESRFTTWAYRFVIFEVTAKIGRHFWRHPGVAAHLRACGPCREDFEGLLAAIAAEAS